MLVPDAPRDRPACLRIGIVLTAILAGLAFVLLGLLLGALLGIGGLAIPASAPTDWPVAAFVLGLGAGVVALWMAVKAFVLYVCWRAWEMDRTWLWVLIVVSALGILDTGPFGLAVGVVTIVGAVQALDDDMGERGRAADRDQRVS